MDSPVQAVWRQTMAINCPQGVGAEEQFSTAAVSKGDGTAEFHGS